MKHLSRLEDINSWNSLLALSLVDLLYLSYSSHHIQNQSPKGIKWSAVPLACLTRNFNEFFLRILGRKQGSRPDNGQRPVEWGDFPSVHLSLVHSQTWLAWPCWLGLRRG